MKTLNDFWPRFLERVLPWLVLFVVVAYTIARFVYVPYLGFVYTSEGEVIELYDTSLEGEQLQLGDHIKAIDNIPWSEYATSSSTTLFGEVQPGNPISIEIRRNQRDLTVNWIFPGPTFAELAQRLNSEWWLPFVFWLGGVAVALLIRPRDTRWQLLIAFNFVTAIWLATGGFAVSNIWGILPLFKSAVWLSVPVYLNLHWVFPHPLRKLPSWFIKVSYAPFLVLTGLEWLEMLPSTFYYTGFLLAIGGSLVLVVGRFIIRPNERRELGLFLLAILLVFLPPLLFTVSSLVGLELPVFVQGGALMASPAIPGIYFFIVYRYQLGQLQRQAGRLAKAYVSVIFVGTIFIILSPFLFNFLAPAGSTFSLGIGLTLLAAVLAVTSLTPFLLLPALAGAYQIRHYETEHLLEIRANHLLPSFLFSVLLVTVIIILAILAEAYLDFPGATILTVIVAGVLSSVFTAFFYGPFQRFIDRTLLGVPLVPEKLSQQYLARIVVSLSRAELVSVLTNQVLPTLLIRQSALYFTSDLHGESQVGHALYVYGFPSDELPDSCSLNDFLSLPEQVVSTPFSAPWRWVRLAIPLNLSGQLVGIWLLGRRDPDDLYGQTETALLQNIANQTAIALSHILQTETLRALYQSNIDRQEEEKKSLAHDLHDEVLNRVTELAMYVDVSSANAQFHSSYKKLSAYLRQTIGGLRPAMLVYGLSEALEELVDEMAARGNHESTISFKVNSVPYRYPEKVEEHLYRILQQAAENALRYAQAQNIYIDGRLDETEISLSVVDDGIGFALEKPVNSLTLVSQKHFGIAGMYERAALIGARLLIDSNPGQGTTVTVTWQKP
ncbi:MAG: hypothetical protein CL608_04625 [Anaerolineaceae bacterium]|nr:hypothetical protein [Anaerolineaceae bacterium]